MCCVPIYGLTLQISMFRDILVQLNSGRKAIAKWLDIEELHNTCIPIIYQIKKFYMRKNKVRGKLWEEAIQDIDWRRIPLNKLEKTKEMFIINFSIFSYILINTPFRNINSNILTSFIHLQLYHFKKGRDSFSSQCINKSRWCCIKMSRTFWGKNSKAISNLVETTHIFINLVWWLIYISPTTVRQNARERRNGWQNFHVALSCVLPHCRGDIATVRNVLYQPS